MWYFVVGFFLQLVLLLAVSLQVSARLRRSELEQDMCGKGVMEGEKKRYAVLTRNRLVASWPITVLLVAAGVYLIACIAFLVYLKKTEDELSKSVLICAILALLHIVVLFYLQFIRFSNKGYLDDLKGLGGFLKKIVERKNDAAYQKGIPLGFRELYHRISDRVAARLQLSSRKDAEMKMASMSDIDLAYYYQPGQDHDYKLILPEFDCRLIYSQCTQGPPPNCLKADNTKCIDKNVASSISYLFASEGNNAIEENFSKVITLYHIIERLRDMQYADPSKRVQNRTMFVRFYIYMMLIVIGAWVFHMVYANVDDISICIVVIVTVLISVYAGSYIQ